MKPDDNGLPTLGSSASKLGVRLGKDVHPSNDGLVHPCNEGGLSVTPDRPERIFWPLRPKVLGGDGKHPAYGIDVEDLGPSLEFNRDPNNPVNHGLIGPAYPMPFEEYEAAIHATAASWRRVT